MPWQGIGRFRHGTVQYRWTAGILSLDPQNDLKRNLVYSSTLMAHYWLLSASRCTCLHVTWTCPHMFNIITWQKKKTPALFLSGTTLVIHLLLQLRFGCCWSPQNFSPTRVGDGICISIWTGTCILGPGPQTQAPSPPPAVPSRCSLNADDRINYVV
jgi:hypothetical protein